MSRSSSSVVTLVGGPGRADAHPTGYSAAVVDAAGAHKSGRLVHNLPAFVTIAAPPAAAASSVPNALVVRPSATIAGLVSEVAMIPRFALVRARSLDEAFDAFASAGGDAAYLAGGTELLQVMKMGLASFGTLVDLKPIAALAGITVSDSGGVRIGAASSHREIERSAVVGERLPALAALEGRVANVRVRNQGTFGGNLAFAEPHSDPATFLLACDARVDLAGPSGTRTLPVGEFVVGPLATAREPEEVLVAIDVPPAATGVGRGYAKIAFFERPAVSVAVEVALADGAIGGARVAVGSMLEAPALVPDASGALVGTPASGPPNGELRDAVARAAEAFGRLDAIEDLNGSADYKRHLAGVLLLRAARDAVGEAVAHA
jgi:carbon-monoxide dehydrogenase medium subunit